MLFQDQKITKSSNLFLVHCGEGLDKLASENTALSTERVTLLEKVSALEKELSAFKKASDMASQGTIHGSQIRSKVAELTGRLEVSSNSGSTSSRSFAEKVSSTKGPAPKSSISTRSAEDRLRSI